MKNTTSIKKSLLFVCMVMTIALTCVKAGEDEDEIPYSEAQILLFKRPHLSNVLQSVNLAYKFKQTGTQAFTDSVMARIMQVHADGTRDLSFDFLSDDRKENYPDIDGFRGNPLVMLFLEWDTGKMGNAQGTLASKNFFRNRVRIGFWKYSKVDEVEVEYGDERYKGRRITMLPFVNNEADRVMAAKFADKQYEFILVDEIPGELYQISTKMVSGESEEAETTQMTFNELKPLK